MRNDPHRHEVYATAACADSVQCHAKCAYPEQGQSGGTWRVPTWRDTMRPCRPEDLLGPDVRRAVYTAVREILHHARDCHEVSAAGALLVHTLGGGEWPVLS
jgi:hypothetical protein